MTDTFGNVKNAPQEVRPIRNMFCISKAYVFMPNGMLIAKLNPMFKWSLY
jgi:hypothetical protein